MKDFRKDFSIEISHSLNKENNLLLSVVRVFYNNSGLGCEEKYNI